MTDIKCLSILKKEEEQSSTIRPTHWFDVDDSEWTVSTVEYKKNQLRKLKTANSRSNFDYYVFEYKNSSGHILLRMRR